LKAILTNCLRHGVTGQNREGHADFRGHLQGRVAWVAALSPARGAKLRELAEAIDWTAPPGSVTGEPSR
jgi:RNA-directed DNA polymerase